MSIFKPQTQTVGACEATILNVGDSQIRMSDVMDVPESQWRKEHAWFANPTRSPVQAVLIRHPDLTVLVDTCAAMPPDSPYAIADAPKQPDLLAQLSQLGVSPDSVEHVVFTHAHFDHLNAALRPDGSATFSNARHHLGRADYLDETLQQHLTEAFGTPHPPARLEALDLLDLIDSKRSLHPDIQVLPAPGESPGHHIVRVQSRGQTLYAVGDLFHHPVEVQRPEWCTRWGDAAAMLASRRRLFERALQEDAVLVAAHIAGFGRLKNSNAGLRWETLSGSD